MPDATLREQARLIWQAGVDAVDPWELVRKALTKPWLELRRALKAGGRLLVVGAGKAGAAMAAGVEDALGDDLDRIRGVVNVPEGSTARLKAIRLHAARPQGSNQPTEQGVAGAEEMLRLLSTAGADDVALCLLSGGGSALLPAPVAGVSLQAKQKLTRLLHECGATINEMNCVRKHLSRVKGGRLAEAFTGWALFSFIVSDVIGDPLDVIASGPTAADPTTFAEALDILQRYELKSRVPLAVLRRLQQGQAGQHPETPKLLPERVHNLVLGNNAIALDAASRRAATLGWPVLSLGSFLEGETREIAAALVGVVRSICRDGVPMRPPVCLLSGGETTVTLPARHGKGGRNQEFVLAALRRLAAAGLGQVLVFSGGTDGEDGPTSAAGAVADAGTLARAQSLRLDPAPFLARHDAYSFFAKTGDLIETGLTGTNVMDVRLFLIPR